MYRILPDAILLVFIFSVGPGRSLPAQSTDSYVINTVVGNGSSGDGGDGGPATGAQLSYPTGMAVATTGDLYIADMGNHRIRKVTPDGVISTVMGSGTAGFSGDGGPATAAQLNSPRGVALDSSNNLYIADTGNSRIRKVTPESMVSTVAGIGPPSGVPNFQDNGDGGPATSAKLWSSNGVALDGLGNLYIADDAGQVRKVSPGGLISTVAGAQPKGGPLPGQPPCFIQEGIPAISAILGGPASVAVDAEGNVYIAEPLEDKIRKVTPDGLIRTVAGYLFYPVGCGVTITSATSTRLFRPQGLALDVEGNMYVADTLNNVIRKVTPDGQIIRLAGLGHSGYSGDGGLASWACLQQPSAVVVAQEGSIYIADTNSHRIRKVSRSNGSLPALTSWLLPSSARTAGAAGSYWTTRLTVANTGTAEAPLLLKFLGHDQDGRAGAEQAYVIPPSNSLPIADVLGTIYQWDNYGALLLTSTSPVLALLG